MNPDGTVQRQFTDTVGPGFNSFGNWGEICAEDDEDDDDDN